jgi:hypothetical protein
MQVDKNVCMCVHSRGSLCVHEAPTQPALALSLVWLCLGEHFRLDESETLPLVHLRPAPLSPHRRFYLFRSRVPPQSAAAFYCVCNSGTLNYMLLKGPESPVPITQIVFPH